MAFVKKTGPLAGTYPTERQYRNALARSEGFSTLDQKLKAVQTSEYKTLVEDARTAYKERTGRNLPASIARHIANFSFATLSEKASAARDLGYAYAKNHRDEKHFETLFHRVSPYFTKRTYDRIKQGKMKLTDIPGMRAYLDYIGVDEDDYVIWYH